MLEGAGILINEDIFTHDSNQRIVIRGGTTFQNDGTFEFTTGGGDVRADNAAGGVFLNSAGGVLNATDSGTVAFQANGANRLTLDNQGSLQVVAQATNTEIDVQGNVTVPQFDGTDTLTGGTWRVSAAAGLTSELDLNPAPDNSITTLATGAEVELAGTGTVEFDQLALTTLDGGTFKVSDGYQHTGNIATTATGGTVGGDGGTIMGDLSGNLTFDPGSELTGDPTGTLTIDGNVGPLSGLTFGLGIEDITDPGNESDLLVVDGTLDLSPLGPGSIMVDLEDLTGLPLDLPNTDFSLLFAQTEGVTGFDAGDFTVNADPAFTGFFSVSEIGDDLFLNYSLSSTVIPEPQTLAIWCLLGLAAGVFRIVRKRTR